jgi:hypothetical protein
MLRIVVVVAQQSAPRHSPAPEQKDVRRVILAGRILIRVGEILDIIPQDAGLGVGEHIGETGQREQVVR